MTAGWPFRSRLLKLVFLVSVGIMLLAALAGLALAFIEQEFGARSIAALTVGVGAVLIAVAALAADVMTRKFHPETSLFLWSDVDQLRVLARQATDEETRAWALSLSDRIAVVLPGRK